MFLAHLPAGYLLTRGVERRGATAPGLMAVGLVASVLPDLDLLYFYLIDGRQTAHHAYVTHFPAFWLLLAGVGAAALLALGRRDGLVYVWVALANVLLHLVLDSVAAEIYWLWPLSTAQVNLVHVPDLHDPWFMNVLWHWTSLVELAIVAMACLVFWRDRRRRRLTAPPS